MVLLYINTKRRHATEWRSGRVVGQHLLHGDAVGLSGTARTGSGSDGTGGRPELGPWRARGDRPGSGQLGNGTGLPARCATGIMIKTEALDVA